MEILDAFSEYLSTHGPELFGVVVSTWIGAAAAFRLERFARNREKRTEQLSHGRRAQVSLLGQYEFLKNVRLHYLGPLENHSERWRLLSPMLFFSSPPNVDVQALQYLLESEPELLHQLVIHDSVVATAAGVARERNTLYDRFKERYVELGEPLERKDIEQSIGPNITEGLKWLTDNLYYSVDRALVSVRANYQRLTRRLAVEFGEKRPLDEALLSEIDAKWEAEVEEAAGSEAAGRPTKALKRTPDGAA